MSVRRQPGEAERARSCHARQIPSEGIRWAAGVGRDEAASDAERGGRCVGARNVETPPTPSSGLLPWFTALTLGDAGHMLFHRGGLPPLQRAALGTGAPLSEPCEEASGSSIGGSSPQRLNCLEQAAQEGSKLEHSDLRFLQCLLLRKQAGTAWPTAQWAAEERGALALRKPNPAAPDMGGSCPEPMGCDSSQRKLSLGSPDPYSFMMVPGSPPM